MLALLGVIVAAVAFIVSVYDRHTNPHATIASHAADLVARTTAAPTTEGSALATALSRHGLDPASARALGSFTDSSGATYTLYLADGAKKSCLLEADQAGDLGGGCDADLFRGHNVAYSEFSAGGSPAAPDSLHVAGVAKAGIDQLTVKNSDGTARDVQVRANGAFFYAAASTSLRRGVFPAALISRNGTGAVDTAPVAAP